MNCPNCGKPAAAGARFCATCGTPIPVSEPVDTGYTTILPPKPAKVRKKGPIVAALCIVLAAALILGGVLWYTMSRPTNQLLMAMGKSGEALADYVGKADRLEAFGENLAALMEERTFTVDFSANGDGTRVNLDANYSLKDKAMDGSVAISSYSYYDSYDANIQFYASDDLLQLSAPPYITGVYGIPLKNLKENFENSYLGRMSGMTLPENFELNLFSKDSNNFIEEYREELDAFVDSLVVTNTGKQALTLGGRSKNCTVYDVSWSDDALAKLLLKVMIDRNYNSFNNLPAEYADMYRERLESSIYEAVDGLGMKFYTSGGYMVGVDLIAQEEVASIRLEGTKNIWDTMTVSSGTLSGEVWNSLTLWLDVDEDNLKLEAYHRDYGSLMKLTYSNSDGSVSLYTDGDWVFDGTIRDDEQGVYVRIYTGDFECSLELSPMKEKPQVLSREYTNILDMNENDWLRLQRDLSSMTD